MQDFSEEEYDVRICKIIDARHHEEVGTEDDPAYVQSIQLRLEDDTTGGTFIAPLNGADVQALSDLDFELNSKEMIEIAQWLRDCELQVKVLVPKNGNKITKSLLLNTRASTTSDSSGGRSASFSRFKFNKEKIKG